MERLDSNCQRGRYHHSRRLQPFEERSRFGELRKEFFVGLELRGMEAAATPAQLHGMFQVQHFVVDDVLQRVTRNAAVIEDATDHDGIVRGIKVAEAVQGAAAAPGQLRAGEKSPEETGI